MDDDVSQDDLNLMGDLGGKTWDPSDWGLDLNLSDIWKAAKGIFGLTGGGASKAADFAGTLGLAALANKALGIGGGGPQGYQGGIPTYTAERQQLQAPAYTPYAQFTPGSTAYRPGQGGVSYFAPMRYTTGDIAKTESTNQSGAMPLPGVAEDTGATPPRVENPVPAELVNENGIPRAYAQGGGITMLAAGGRYIKGPGDGVSDSVPATIHSAQGGQPAALADGEFVIPARVVAEIGNGSNEAGARKLYAMMDRVEQMAKKAKRGKPSGADKELNKLV